MLFLKNTCIWRPWILLKVNYCSLSIYIIWLINLIIKKLEIKLTKNPTIYNIISWFARPMGQTTRRPSVIDLCHSKLYKNNLKGFCKKICKILWKKNNTWNIRRLVDESFPPSAQRTSVLYCRLMDFKTTILYQLLKLI